MTRAAVIAAAAGQMGSPDANVALTVMGTVLAALLAFAGVVWTVRATSRANARTVSVQQRTADQTGMAALVTALQTEVARLTARVDLLERDRVADREALIAEKSLRSLAVTYARDLLAWIAGDRTAPVPLPPAALAREFHRPEGDP